MFVSDEIALYQRSKRAFQSSIRLVHDIESDFQQERNLLAITLSSSKHSMQADYVGVFDFSNTVKASEELRDAAAKDGALLIRGEPLYVL